MFKTAKAWISSLISYVSGPRDECSIGLIEIRDSNPPLPEPINNAANTPRSLDDLVYAQERVYRDEVPGTDGVWMVEDPGTGQLYFIRYDEFRGPGQRGFTQVFGGPYTEASYLGKLDGNPVFVASRLKSYDPGTDRDISAIVNEKGDALFGGWQDGAPMLTPIDSSEDSMRELFNDSRDYDCANCEYDADLKLQSGAGVQNVPQHADLLVACYYENYRIDHLSIIDRAGGVVTDKIPGELLNILGKAAAFKIRKIGSKSFAQVHYRYYFEDPGCHILYSLDGLPEPDIIEVDDRLYQDVLGKTFDCSTGKML